MNPLDKKLEQKRKQTEGDILHKVQCLKGFWKVLFLNPLTYIIAGFLIVSWVFLGTYFEWNYKIMIGKVFEWGIASLITTLLMEKIKGTENK